MDTAEQQKEHSEDQVEVSETAATNAAEENDKNRQEASEMSDHSSEDQIEVVTDEGEEVIKVESGKTDGTAGRAPPETADQSQEENTVRGSTPEEMSESEKPRTVDIDVEPSADDVETHKDGIMDDQSKDSMERPKLSNQTLNDEQNKILHTMLDDVDTGEDKTIDSLHVDLSLPKLDTLPSVDSEELHLAEKALLPTPDPLQGESLLGPGNSLKTIPPVNVNVHQFYPELKLSFVKGTVGEVVMARSDSTDSVSDVEEADRELIVKTISHSAGEEQDAESAARIPSPPDRKCDDAYETEPQDPRGFPKDDLPREETDASVFATQVEESTLEAAKERQNSKLLDPEQWDTKRPGALTMKQVITDKANQHFQKGLKYFEEEDYEKAITCYNKALNLQPNDINCYIQRAEAYFHVCDFQSAILNYKKACVMDPDNYTYYCKLAFVYYFHGQCLFDQKLFPEALEAFSRAAEMRPDVIGYHTRSMACLAALQRHGECLALVNKRLEVETDNADLFILRARLHHLFRNTTLCYYDVKDALALDINHPEGVALMEQLVTKAADAKQQAVHLSLSGRPRDSLQKITVAIETNPSIADYHVLRGALHRRLGDFNAAIDDYLLALDKTDHNEQSYVYIESQRQLLLTYNDFAVECFTKGFYEEAIILLNKAIKGEKQEKGLYVNRGDCFFKEGNVPFALADYQQALDLDPSDGAVRGRIAVIHHHYAQEEHDDKNYKAAEVKFALAIEHNPRVGDYYIARAKTRQMLENTSGARVDLVTCLLLDPNNSEMSSLMVRLFPGKSVKDILKSNAAELAREILASQSSERRTSLVPSQHSEESDEEAESDQRQKQVSKPAQHPASAAVTWKSGFSDLKGCIEDREFNMKLSQNKRKVNDKVKDALQNRKSLRHTGARLRPLPVAVPYTRQGGNPLKKSGVNLIQPPNKTTAGWQNFGLGIGLGN